jgi:adenosine deaminase
MAPLLLDPATIRRAPKVLLHEHLDGGLRPATLYERAGEIGSDALQSQDTVALARRFRAAPGEGGPAGGG